MIRRLLPLTAIIAATIAGGCDNNIIQASYSDFRQIEPDGWSYDDTLLFTADVAPQARGILTVALRHSIDYPYRNLWIETTLEGDSVSAPRRDTLCIELADPFGRWLGTGQGASRQVKASLPHSVSVDSGRTIAVRHLMRLDTVPDIEQVGLFILPDSDFTPNTSE
ncbi:MAG: gliding motility lipoprotein GldH [Paramuribaculum sp.]|nr:gliding motility lipoprotein GldH [Paramuribaculum sp.]